MCLFLQFWYKYGSHSMLENRILCVVKTEGKNLDEWEEDSTGREILFHTGI